MAYRTKYGRLVSEEFMKLSETEKEAIWDFINRCEPYDKEWAVQLYNDCMRAELAPFELLHYMKEEKLIDKGHIQSIIMYDGD